MLKLMLRFSFKVKSINNSCLISIYSWPILFFFNFYDARISLFPMSRVFKYTKFKIGYVFGLIKT